MAGKRRQAIGRDGARRLLATGLRACTHCAPDTQLHITGLSTPAPSPRPRGHTAQNRGPPR
ncbi:DUF6233 domain-containing protein [Streptomyces sp. NPDC058739]|uniref:DUF6233 domain-containing protein n=1 Tax=Streptomyces sp. NPDC058739 TaxID=3346618 RepID=UPI003695688B